MKFKTTKKLLAGALAAGLLALQPIPAFAATSEQAGWGAKLAVEYLQDNQHPVNGGIVDFAGIGDWAVMAIAATGQDPDAFENVAGESVLDFIKSDPIVDSTDVARRILAANAAGFGHSAFAPEYIEDLAAQLAALYDGTQIGEPTDLNDDMFGIMAAAVVIGAVSDGTTAATLQTMAEKSLSYLIQYQEADGGFSYTTNDCPDWCGASADMTAAAIVAMKAAEAHGFVTDDTAFQTALSDAQTYLFGAQYDGGFFDSYTTAWALMGLNALGATDEAAQARAWLLARQNADGGFDGWTCGASDVSTTLHVVPALLGTTWMLEPAISITPPFEAPDETITHVDCPTSTPTPQPTEQPELEEVVNTATPTSTPAPSQPATPTPKPQTLAVKTTTEDAATTEQEEPTAESSTATVVAEKTSGSGMKYVFYAIVALAFITIGWRLAQPEKSKNS